MKNVESPDTHKETPSHRNVAVSTQEVPQPTDITWRDEKKPKDGT
jgi:hypothetical protein